MNDKPNKQHEQRLIVVLVLLLLALCAANLWFGSVQIPASAVWDIPVSYTHLTLPTNSLV